MSIFEIKNNVNVELLKRLLYIYLFISDQIWWKCAEIIDNNDDVVNFSNLFLNVTIKSTLICRLSLR